MFYLFHTGSRLSDIDPIEPDGADELGRPWPVDASFPKEVGCPTRWVYATKDPRSQRHNETATGSFQLTRGDSSGSSGSFGTRM